MRGRGESSQVKGVAAFRAMARLRVMRDCQHCSRSEFGCSRWGTGVSEQCNMRVGVGQLS